MKAWFAAAIPIALLVLIVALVAGCGASMVAEVNGKEITTADLESAMKEAQSSFQNLGELPEKGTDEYREIEKNVLERLVIEEILWFEAEKLGITVSTEEVTEQVERINEQVGGRDQLDSLLAEQNMSLREFQEQQRKSLLFQRLFPEVTRDAEPVTDEQALEYYNQNQALFTKPETRKVRHIVVGDEAAANQVIARLNAGEDFAAVAAEVSTDPGSKDQGGDLGEVATQNSGLVPEFEEAMGQLAAGQTSGPVQSSFGFHVIQVTEIIPAGLQSFEQVREELVQGLFMENQRESFDAWLAEVKGAYTINYAPGYEPDTPQAGAGEQPEEAGAPGNGQPQAQPAAP
ncbi:MAG: peptidyl-prolyl cis-trans isomerase [Thermoleophilia bacterium]|nr:peptidyl-prolyl cis-trans isomerase [Thermoleophilia bacterium]